MKKITLLAMSLFTALMVNAQETWTDVTSVFTNPDFEAGSSDGWTIDGPTGGQNLGTASTAANNGYQGTHFMEAWCPSERAQQGFTWSQTQEIPNGYYVVKALAHAIRQSDESLVPTGVYLFAEDSETQVTTIRAAEYAVFTTVADESLTIGLRGTDCNSNWIACDYFRVLQFTADSEEAAKIEWAKYEMRLLAEELSTLIENDMYVTLREEIEASIAAIETVADYASADALWQKMKKQVTDAKTSIELYSKWNDELNEILSDILIDESMIGYEDLATLTYASMDKYSAGSLDAAGVEAELAMLADAVFVFEVSNLVDGQGFDVTELFMKNPTMRSSVDNWEFAEGSAKPGFEHEVAEFYNCDFDMYQKIENVPNGKYVVHLQGFYRVGGNDSGAAYQAGTEDITAQLYANKASMPLLSIYKYKASEMAVSADVLNDYVNMRNSANMAFNTYNPATGLNYYAENALEVIVMDGTLTIGLRNSGHAGSSWCAFREFKLEYFGNFPATNLKAKIQEINAYLLDNVDNIPNAVAMEVGDFIYALEDMGLTDKGASEEEVNAAIIALDSVWAEAKESFKIFDELKALCYQIEEETLPLNYPGKADLQAALRTASAYLASDCEENTRENMLAMIEELKAAIVTYVFTQEATRENPADVSYFLVKAFGANKDYGFKDWEVNVEGENTGDVWTGPGLDWVVAPGDTVKMTCLNSWSDNFISMDASLEIVGVPDGVYSVVADAVTQTGCLNDQHVYAASTMGVAESAPMTIEGWDYSNWETLTTDLLVVADGKLRIGFASTSTGGTNGWFQVANFKLRYHGAATDEDLVAAWESTKTRADEAVAILLIGDEGSLIAAVSEGAALAASAKYVEACGKVSPALDAVSYALNVTKKFYAGNYDQLDNDTTFYKYQYAPKVAENTIALTDALLAVDTVTYRALEAVDTKLTGYVNYVTGMKEVEDMLAENSKKFDQTQVTFLVENVINPQIAALAEKLHNATDCDTLLIRLKNAASRLQRTILQDLEVGDVTYLIQNPTVDVIDGWIVEKNDATNCGTNKGESYTGDGSNSYLDAWNGTAGKMNSTFYQEFAGIPNGVYRLTAAARADGDNAWIFAAPDAPNAETTQFAMVKNYGAWGGEIWEAAKAEWEAAGCPEDGDFPFFTTRADSTGYGWSWYVIENIVVTDRYLAIGLSANKDFCGKEDGFTGTWMGADDWKLELIEKTETGEYSPFTGVENIEVVAPVVKGIYDLFGRRVETPTVSGIYIIDGRKVVIKK